MLHTDPPKSLYFNENPGGGGGGGIQGRVLELIKVFCFVFENSEFLQGWPA